MNDIKTELCIFKKLLIFFFLSVFTFNSYAQKTYYFNKVYPYTCSADRKATIWYREARVSVDENNQRATIKIQNADGEWLVETFKIDSKEIYTNDNTYFGLLDSQRRKWSLWYWKHADIISWDISLSLIEYEGYNFEFIKPYKILNK